MNQQPLLDASQSEINLLQNRVRFGQTPRVRKDAMDRLTKIKNEREYSLTSVSVHSQERQERETGHAAPSPPRADPPPGPQAAARAVQHNPSNNQGDVE